MGGGKTQGKDGMGQGPGRMGQGPGVVWGKKGLWGRVKKPRKGGRLETGLRSSCRVVSMHHTAFPSPGFATLSVARPFSICVCSANRKLSGPCRSPELVTCGQRTGRDPARGWGGVIAAISPASHGCGTPVPGRG